MSEKSGIVETEHGSCDWEVMSDLITITEDGDEVYGDEYVRINNLIVKPEFRGQGFAKSLLSASIALIEKSYPRMTIKTVAEPKEESVDLDRLSNFYASMGLEVVCF